MVEETSQEMQSQEEMSDEQAILRIAQAMKDNVPSVDEKQNVHTFLFNVVQAENIKRVSKIGNLKDGSEKGKIDELGVPSWNVRGALEMGRISKSIMNNSFFQSYFESSAEETLSSSLSREGFLVRQATTQTKAVADITRRRRINSGMFKKKVEESGGDPYINQGGVT